MLVQVYGDNAIHEENSSLQLGDTVFFKGRKSGTVEERSGRPAKSRTEESIAKVHQIVHENHWLTVRSVAEQANIDRETEKS
jgi:hypothetical protein